MSIHRSASSRRVAVVSVAVAALAAACGSSGSSKGAATGDTSTSTVPTKTATDLRGKRYCEVLLLRAAPAGITADVYNTYPINACPEVQWKAMDAGAIKTENGALAALLNGPRYWLMDRIEKDDARAQTHKTFGAMEMIQRATVVVGNPVVASQPYHLNAVDRRTVFSYDKGSTVHEITTADGTKFVMQSWSQQVDPTLDEAGLAALGPRLHLPAGWSYGTRTLTAPLRVDTRSDTAKVFQDDFKNTYSMETS
jgi:hypothetical protein